MSRIRLLGVCLIAVFAFSAIVATAAMAEEKTKMLPESGVKFISKGGKGELTTLGGVLSVKCEKLTGKNGTIESANLGKYETLFEECTSSGGKCTGVGLTTGDILNAGTYHFWLALETLNGTANTLVGALVFLPEELHFTCVVIGTNVLVLVKGCIAALATPLNALASVTKDTFAVTGAGDPLITKVLPAGSTAEIECLLLSSKSEGTFEMSGLTVVAENEKFESGGTALTVLLMNPEAKE
jgi:hypothetical protein